MRFHVLSNHALLSRVSSVALLGCLVASCSSGFQRFDSSFYENAVPQQTAQNPYPGNIDAQTTASTRGRLAPVADVASKADPQGVYHTPEPTYVAPQLQTQPIYTPQPYEPYISAQQPQVSSAPVRRSLSEAHKLTQNPLPQVQPTQLPKPAYQPPVASSAREIQRAAGYEPPQPEIKPNTVYIPKPSTDSLKTAAVNAAPVTATAAVSAPVAPVVPINTTSSARTTSDGWSSAGGTTIQVGQGETLYNISKRYGVPVSAIRDVNAMAPGTSLQAGQSIIIPNYVFSQSLGVSAPDNNPQTRAARAGRGYIGEANPLTVPSPTKRPYTTAAVSASGEVYDAKRQRYVPKTHVEPPTKEQTPDYSVVTGSVTPVVTANVQTEGFYTVKSGDTLSKIARETGTSITALQSANGMTDTNLRIGQKLVLPGGATPVIAAPKQQQEAENTSLPPNVDPMITGSVNPSSVDKDIDAPARTGISDFRWPVNGRVVSNFGDNGTNGKNEGIDISVPEGTAVKAAENGVVIYAGDEIASYGKLILVRHADGWVSAYAHNRDFEVKKGDQVRRGQTIARSGRTGNAERPKLHFELRKDSAPVNPEKYLAS